MKRLGDDGGQWADALKLFRAIGEGGFNHSAAAYAAAISALAAGGQCGQALQLFGEMWRRGLDRDAATYSAVLAALEKGGEWMLALRLFRRWRSLSRFRKQSSTGTEIVNTYISVLDVLGAAGEWQQAWHIYVEMENRGIQPNAAAHGAIISALRRGGEYGIADRLARDLKALPSKELQDL